MLSLSLNQNYILAFSRGRTPTEGYQKHNTRFNVGLNFGAIGDLEIFAANADRIAEQGNRRRQVMEMTKAQLRAECKRMRLPVSGNKATLQERILQAS